jgi:hypothetical protein
MSKKKLRFAILLAICAAALGVAVAGWAHPAWAQQANAPQATRTWTGEGISNNWVTPFNWGILGSLPAAGDDLVFPATAARKTNTNNLPANTTLSSMTINGADYIIGGNALTLAQPGVANFTALTVNTPVNTDEVRLDMPITVGGDAGATQRWSVEQGTLFVNGPLHLTRRLLISAPPEGRVFLKGPISGDGVSLSLRDFGSFRIERSTPLDVVVDAGARLIVANNQSIGRLSLDSQVFRCAGNCGVRQLLAANAGLASVGSDGVGTISVTETARFSPQKRIDFDLNGAEAGVTYDRFVAGGDISLNGVELELVLGFTPALGQQFTIMQSTGGVISGQFAEGNRIVVDGRPFDITYNQHSVVLTARAGNALLSFSDLSATVSEGAGQATMTVSRAGEERTPVTVDFRSNDSFAFTDCATNNGQANQRCDYTTVSGTLSFAPGETSKTISVPVNDDFYNENNETVTFSLSNPIGENVAVNPLRDTHTLTLTDNDSVTPAERVFIAQLNGAQVSPAVTTNASGAAVITLNAAETQISVILTFTNLTGQTAARIHGPAPVETNGPTLFNLPTGQIIAPQSFAINATQRAQLKAGLFYLNLTTTANPNGEIRGQILPNPAESARFFVRQQYHDFLSRVPDQAGWDFWTGQITGTGSNLTALAQRRVAVSNAFFFELEYQQTGAFTYRLYREAFGNTQPFGNPTGDMDSNPFCQANPQNCQLIRAAHIPSYEKFARDRARLDAANLAATQLALATSFGQRPEFTGRYPLSQTAEQFVDALIANIQAASGANLTSQRAALISLYNGTTGGQAAQRGAVLFRLAEDNQTGNPINNRPFIDAEYNRAFVTTQYFGYLRRDGDLPGLNFWLSVLNQFPLRSPTGQNGMVCAFITSGEYQQRFNTYSTRTNQTDCQ